MNLVKVKGEFKVEKVKRTKIKVGVMGKKKTLALITIRGKL